MAIFTLTNEIPGERAGGIGMYIAGLQEVLQERLGVEFIPKFPKTVALLKYFVQHTRRGDQIWIHHVFPLGIPALLLRLFGGRVYTIFLHGNDFDTARQHMIRGTLLLLILRCAKRVVVNSHSLAGDVERLYGILPTVLQPWLPTDFEKAISLPASAVERDSEKIVLTVGRFIPRKGFDVLIEAAAQLPEFTFVFSGPKNAYAETLLGRAGSNVRFVLDPARPAMLDLYRKASVFAMPTIKTQQDREGFGIVYLEAQYAGLPVLAVGHRETREAIAPALQSLLIHEPSCEEIVAMIPMLIHHGREWSAEIRDFVKENHTLSARQLIINQLAS